MWAEVAEFEERFIAGALDAAPEARQFSAILPDRRTVSGVDPSDSIAGWWREPGGEAPWVLANPWDDRKAVALYDSWTWDLAERALARAGPLLGQLTGAERTARYWALLLMPWLLHAVSALVDRSLFLRTARSLAPDAPLVGATDWAPPVSLTEAQASYFTDLGNSALVALVAEQLGIPVERGAGPAAPALSPPPAANRLSRLLTAPGAAAGGQALARRVVARVLRPRGNARVLLLANLHLTSTDTFRLARSVRGLRLGTATPAPTWSGELGPRGAGEGGDRGVDALIDALLPVLLPVSVAEGYAGLRAHSEARFGRPDTVVVDNYSLDELQNELVARTLTEGRRAIFAQHGATYCQALVNPQEPLERPPEGTFASWGPGGRDARPVPSPYASRLRDTHRGGNQVVLVEWMEPPVVYMIRFVSAPLCNQAYEVGQGLARFAEAVSSPPAREALRLKRFPPFLAESSPRPAVLSRLAETSHRRAPDAMRAARVAVLPYTDTPLIEALAVGVPTIAFWNPDHFEMRPEAQPHFDALRAVGIVHDDPESAAAKLDEVYADPAPWWDSERVRSARNGFLDAFAPDGDWLSGWTELLASQEP